MILLMAAMGGASGPAIADLTAPDEFTRAWVRLASRSGPIEPKDRLAAILDLAWRETMVESPEAATLFGYPGLNDRWSDRSPGAYGRRRARWRDIKAALAAVDRSRLDPGDRLNHDLFLHDIEDELAAARFPREWLAVTQLGGPQQEAARILALAPAATPADYRDQVARLRGIGRLIDETIALLEAGLAHGVTPPRVTLRDVPAQALSQVPDDPWKSPLLAAFTRFPAGFPESGKEPLRLEAARAYREVAVPAFRRLHEFLAGAYIPKTRETVACRALPEGEAWYAWLIRHHTTTALDARAIHDLGTAEVRRLRTAMEAIIREVGFKGSFAEFAAFLRSDPRFFFTDADALVKEYRDVAKRADPELVRLFGRLPRLPYGVVPVPEHAAPSQTTAYYEPGSPEAGRPGYYFVNTWNLAARPKWEMEALSLHEAVPGHHLQIALAQEMTGLPEFRRHGGTTAFVEGWALYAESLGHEMGMYRDPYARFGQLTYEMWRAIRLVVDTGIHALGWSRAQAIEFFRDNSAKTEHDIVVEIDRYIVDPGQALAYKIGELRIRDLRASLSAELGPRFDLRAFHDAVLENGALPLGVLEERLRQWAADRRAAP